MREILFRGKRIDNGEWVKGWLKPFSNAGYAGKDDRLCIQDGMYSLNIHEIDPKTVGQYIGLQDKNGVKIFEGDIISTGHELVTAVWRGTQILALKSNNRPMTWEIAERGEVIGNIYDNPELIKNRKI